MERTAVGFVAPVSTVVVTVAPVIRRYTVSVVTSPRAVWASYKYIVSGFSQWKACFVFQSPHTTSHRPLQRHNSLGFSNKLPIRDR